MKILYYFEGVGGGCAQYRAIIPGRYLARKGGHEVVATGVLSDDLIRKADIIVFQKRFYPNDELWLQRCRNLGKRTVMEFDDDYLTLPKWNGTAPIFAPIKATFLRMVKDVTFCTVTTDHLKAQYATRAGVVKVLPNSIDVAGFDLDRATKSFPAPVCLNHPNPVDWKGLSGYKVGWAGSSTHSGDLELVQDTLVNLARKLPNLKIFMMGACNQKVLDLVPKNQLYLIAHVPVDAYLWTLAELRLDVGIAPIAREKFNLSKSNLKVLEYGTMGTVPLASSFGEYHKTLVGSNAGFLCSSAQDWEMRILQLSINQALLKNMKVAARRLVEDKFDIGKNWKLWEEAYFS